MGCLCCDRLSEVQLADVTRAGRGIDLQTPSVLLECVLVCRFGENLDQASEFGFGDQRNLTHFDTRKRALFYCKRWKIAS